MAIALTKHNGASWEIGKDGSAKLGMYVFFDPLTEDEQDIEDAANAALPSVYVGYILRKMNFKEHGYGMVEAVGDYTGQLTSEEAGEDPGESPPPPDFAFEIASTQVKVFSSYAVIDSGEAEDETIPDNGTLIGVKDGKVEGVEVPQMTYNFSETHHFGVVTTAYKILLASLVGTVNFGSGFLGFAAGEVMLTGVSGSQTANGLWSLRFQFSVLPNATDLAVGDFEITKAGWDYIEWFTKDSDNVTNKTLEKTLIGWRVHRVLREGNFLLLGIGS